MNLEAYRKYETLILRIFFGLTLLTLGYQKLTIDILIDVFEKLYGQLMILNAGTFLVVVGVVQILMGFALIIGFYTRVVAGLLGLMAVVTIILTGIILLSGIIHFAYAFATLGGAIVLFIHGSGAYSMDEMIRSESPAG